MVWEKDTLIHELYCRHRIIVSTVAWRSLSFLISLILMKLCCPLHIYTHVCGPFHRFVFSFSCY
ncbi:uncharacterized protein DS421_14g449770 [Arachis hypogaea]|nr:uncharacterized protein DS421_14g449770 [Arachis hypogaea]